MKKIIYLFLICFLSLEFGCSSGKKDLTQPKTGKIPEWYLNKPKDAEYIFAAYTATSQDLQMAVDKSVMGGRAEIGRIIDLKLKDLQKKFAEEVGEGSHAALLQEFTQATKTIVNTVLNGSDIKEKSVVKDGNLWRAYVLIQYPIGAANVALMQQLQKNDELYTRFRSTKAFEELDKETKE